MAAQDGAASERASQSAGNGPKGGSKIWGEILSANGSVMVWLVFLAFGGALLSLYHSRIQYFPDLKWEDSLTYLAALSLLGGGVAVIYGLHLFLPGAMWSEFLIHDEDLKDKLCYDVSKTEPCFWSVGIYMGVPYLFFMLIMHFAALPGNALRTTVVAAILLSVISLFLWRLFKEYLDRKEATTPECSCMKEEEQGKKPVTDTEPSIWQRILDFSEGRSKKTRLLRYVIAFDISALASLFSTIILFSLVDSENKLDPKSAMIYICTGLVTLSNFWVAVRLRNRPGQAFLAAFLATLVLLVCSETVDDAKAALSTGIMKKLGLGAEAQLVTLVVDPEGQALFERLKLYPPPEVWKLIDRSKSYPSPEVRKLFEQPKLYPPAKDEAVIPNLLILSRLGEEYFLQATRYEVKEDPITKKRNVLEIRRVKVMIPRQHVLSWSVQPPLKPVQIP